METRHRGNVWCPHSGYLPVDFYKTQYAATRERSYSWGCAWETKAPASLTPVLGLLLWDSNTRQPHFWGNQQSGKGLQSQTDLRLNASVSNPGSVTSSRGFNFTLLICKMAITLEPTYTVFARMQRTSQSESLKMLNILRVTELWHQVVFTLQYRKLKLFLMFYIHGSFCLFSFWEFRRNSSVILLGTKDVGEGSSWDICTHRGKNTKTLSLQRPQAVQD